MVHRRILERVFGVPVFNLYGSTETGHLLMENSPCVVEPQGKLGVVEHVTTRGERGEMKPGYDTAFLEIVNAGADDVGDLVVTTLTNDYMPLLRYRIGDLAERRAQPYGTDFVIHGRIRDALRAGDGRRVTTWQVDECFSEVGGITHYELRQDEEGDCVLRFVPDETGPAETELRRVTSRLESLLCSQAEIKTEAMPVLVPEPSGKFRLTYPAVARPLALAGRAFA